MCRNPTPRGGGVFIFWEWAGLRRTCWVGGCGGDVHLLGMGGAEAGMLGRGVCGGAVHLLGMGGAEAGMLGRGVWGSVVNFFPLMRSMVWRRERAN